MLRKALILCIFFASAVSFSRAADSPTGQTSLSAAEIVERNISARGGLQAWRAVKTMTMAGKLEVGGNDEPTLSPPSRKGKPQIKPPQQPGPQVQLPFLMELKRPRKVRLEIKFNGQTAIQVYDGTNGWKLRPFLNRHEVETYTSEEMKAASMQADLDGPLVDYASKGTQIALEGLEKVEDHDTYKLKLTLKDGRAQHVWLDARTFLETKIEGTPRRLDGKYHDTMTYFRDYRPVNGLMVPFLLETAVQGVKRTEKIQVENVTVDQKLDDSLFAKLQ